MKRTIITLFVLACVTATLAEAKEADMLQVWSVDPLIKVFQDASFVKGTQAAADVARGEYASFQVVVRADAAVTGLKAAVAPFTRKGGGAALEARAPRFVGYVPVDRPTQAPSKDQLRKPPADYPDPLLELDAIDLEPGKAQPVWVTVRIPLDAAPGTYRSELTLAGKAGDREVAAKKALSLKVYEAAVPSCRLHVTEWFSMQWQHMQIAPEPESDEYYALLGRYARNMAEHRHNVALISPISLAAFTVAPDGSLAIDFSRFDRWVQVFTDAGVIGLIEGGHIGGRMGDWDSQFVVQTRTVKDGQVVAASTDPTSPEADAFYARFFPALVQHLRDKGWLDHYVQHLADEPISSNIDSYRAMAALARKYAPELRIVEACHTKDLVGSMDVWVPQLNYLHKDLKHYQERQQAGEEVWLYTCVFPQGEYANRFIEQPLIKTRLLHWINFRYGITGYLHWGYNQWTADSPFTHTTRPHGGPPYLPAGDPWIVYPGKDGPLDSIRFEAMRDGIDDNELLCLLADKDPAAAQKLADKHVLDFDKYDTDVERFRATRRDLLQRVGKLPAKP